MQMRDIDVKLVIGGKEIKLVARGRYQGYDKFTAPREMSGIVVSVFLKPDWRPDEKRVRSVMLDKTSGSPLLRADARD